MKMTSEKRALDKIYKRRDRYEIPDWQRQNVWDESQRQKLVDSILRGWKLPKFYLLKSSEDADTYEIVDGQQRMQAIFDFFDNKLSLSAESERAFNGKFYKDLPPKVSDAVDDFELECDVLTDATEEDVKEFFQRLQSGLPLSSSEKLNAIHSNLRDYAKKLADHTFFRMKVMASNKRYGHFDIAAKVVAIAVEGIETGLRFEDLQELFTGRASFQAESHPAAKRLNRTLEFLLGAFSENSDLLRNRTVVQSYLTFVSSLSTDRLEGKEKLFREFFDSFSKELSRQVELGTKATDLDCVEFQRTVTANLRSGAQKRQLVLIRKFLQFSADTRALVDSSSMATAGISSAIAKKAERVAGLVHDVNAVWSAKTGKDLIKPTNKTVPGLLNMAKPVCDLEGYMTFVDDLYFMFWEGPGDRARYGPSVPQAFSEINLLRTGLRHDVEHGSEKKMTRKRKEIGAVVTKYAGAPSPELVGPEQFPVIQLALLEEVERALGELKVGGPPTSVPAPASGVAGNG